MVGMAETMGIEPMKRFNKSLSGRKGEPFPIPVQLLYARQDPMVSPKMGYEFERLIPGAQLQWLDEASHFAHVDSVDQFADKVLAFDLAQHWGYIPAALALAGFVGVLAGMGETGLKVDFHLLIRNVK